MIRTLACLTPIVAAMAALWPGPADAQLIERFVSPFCYVRSYGAEHLASHPRQRVRTISLRRLPGANPPMSDGSVVEFELSVLARGVRDSWGGVAVCRDGAERLACGMEGDMGQLTLTPLSADSIELRVTGQDGLSFETDKSFESIGAPGGDDRVFRLTRAPMKACAD
jgi:hypothetical protein